MDKYLEYLWQQLEVERKARVDSLGDGVAKDYAAYKELCGVIHGLLLAQSEVNNLLQKVKDDDE